MNFSFLGDRMLNSTILYRSCSNNPSYCKLNGTVAISRREDSQVITSRQCSTTTLQYILLKLKLLLSLLLKIKFIIIISVCMRVCVCVLCLCMSAGTCMLVCRGQIQLSSCIWFSPSILLKQDLSCF